MRRLARSATSSSASAERKRMVGQPSLSARGDVLPEATDGRQPQFVQQQRQPSGIDGDLAHAETSTAPLLNSAL